jgi:hypothetical protein
LDEAMNPAEVKTCLNCSGTGRRRDAVRLLYVFIALVVLVLIGFFRTLPRTENQRIWINGLTAVVELVSLYVLFVGVWGYARSKCLACGGRGGSTVGPRATPFPSLEDRRRLARNRCLGCGYNLTGNQSGICPECGIEINPDWLESQDGVPPDHTEE